MPKWTDLSAAERRLVAENLVRGVPMQNVGVAFELSENDMIALFRFAMAKLKSYWFERKMPFVPCGSITEAQRARVRILHDLQRINLGVEPQYAKIQVERFEDVIPIRRG